MSSNIYNEGRVVGYSAYEVYVRHSRSINPDIEPANEMEWLSSSLAMGNSLLLRVSADSQSQTNTPHWRSFALPNETLPNGTKLYTNLCAANTIVGSYFAGKGDEDNLIGGMWAKSVISYGSGIVNSNSKPDNGNITTSDMENVSSDSSNKIPTASTNLSESEILGLGEYAKILDGIILSPGEWKDSTPAGIKPPKDFSPAISASSTTDVPVIRLLFSGKVAHAFWLLLTGFSLAAVLRGETGIDSSVDTEHPQNGDFLGPATYPWANKIVFSVPPAFLKYFYDSGYIRQIATTSQKEVKSHPIIDMSTTDPKTYYEDVNTSAAASNSQVDLTISKLRITTDDAAVLTVYQRSSIFPPALYGVKVDNPEYNSSAFTAANKLNPIDVVSSGTVKLWKEEELVGDKSDNKEEWISDFEQKTPHNRALIKDSASVLHQLNYSGMDVPVADTYVNSVDGVLVDVLATSPYFHYQTNANDPTYYAGFGAIMNRRITGNLSDAFRADCGLEYGSVELEEVINKVTNIYHLLNSEPDDWSTDWTKYYRKVGDEYVKLTDASAPPFQQEPFYRVNQYQVNISMYTDLISKDLEKLTSEPDDWSTDWTNYYKSDGRKINTDTAPSFESNKYYKKVGNTINKFYFVLQSHSNSSTNAINGWSLIPVRIGTNHIDYIDKVSYSSDNKLNLPWTVPPISTNADFDDRAKFLGTYWGSGADITTLSSHQNHKQYLKSLIDNDVIIQDSNRKVPDASAYVWDSENLIYTEVTYDTWEELYENVTLNDVFPEGSDGRALLNGEEQTFEISGKTIKVTYPNIMTNLYDKTLREFLEYAQVYSVTTGDPLSEDGEEGYKLRKYFARNNQNFFAEDWGSSGGNIRATIDFSVAINRNNYKNSIIVPIPEQYMSTEGSLTSIVRTGDHTTKSLSLADEHGNIYKMTGTDGDILPSDGKIHWDDLLSILANNKAIDILGSDRLTTEIYLKLGAILIAGTGITITDSGDPNYTKTISANIVGGDSIEVRPDGNTLYIDNTAPYLVDSAGYVDLIDSRDSTVSTDSRFSVVRFNGFQSWNENTELWNYGAPRLEVSILPSKSTFNFKKTNGDVVKLPKTIRFNILANPGDWWIGKPIWTSDNINSRGFYGPESFDGGSTTNPGFWFRHAKAIDSVFGQYSWLFGLNFSGNYSNDGISFSLDDMVSATIYGGYSIMDTSQASSGIWNMYQYQDSEHTKVKSIRASWDAKCRMHRGFAKSYTKISSSTAPADWNTKWRDYYWHDDDGYHRNANWFDDRPDWEANTFYVLDPGYYEHREETTKHALLIAHAISYADGYNQQFWKYDTNDGKSIWSDGMNMSLSCMLYH